MCPCMRQIQGFIVLLIVSSCKKGRLLALATIINRVRAKELGCVEYVNKCGMLPLVSLRYSCPLAPRVVSSATGEEGNLCLEQRRQE